MTDNENKLCMGCMSPSTDAQQCPHCGYTSTEPYDVGFLPPGFVLAQRFIIGKKQNSSCEGATYIGYDKERQIKVWIREFMPGALATRNQLNMSIAPIQGSAALYKSLLADFEEVVKSVALAGTSDAMLQTIAIVKENNTCYAVYKFVRAISIGSFVARSGGALDWSRLKRPFLTFMAAVSAVHKRGIIHRGISPETVLIDQSSTLLLTDFCIASARTSLSETGANLETGYAAPEQYSLSGRQGEWTDVYALGALLYQCLTGATPPDASTRRSRTDSLVPPAQMAPGVPQNISDAIVAAMVIPVEERLQSVDDFISALIKESDSVNPALRGTGRAQGDYTKTMPITLDKDNRFEKENARKRKGAKAGKTGGTAKYMLITMVVTAVVLLAAIFVLINEFAPAGEGDPSSASGASSQSEQNNEDKKVPNFVGRKIADVLDSAEYNERFKIETKYEINDDYPEGTIFAQSPDGGVVMLNRGTVILKVSSGSEMIRVPPVEGSEVEAAQQTLDSMGIKYQIIERVDNSAQAGIILGMYPAPDTEIRKNKDTVILYIKSAPIQEPEPESPWDNWWNDDDWDD